VNGERRRRRLQRRRETAKLIGEEGMGVMVGGNVKWK